MWSFGQGMGWGLGALTCTRLAAWRGQTPSVSSIISTALSAPSITSRSLTHRCVLSPCDARRRQTGSADESTAMQSWTADAGCMPAS